MKMVDNCLLLVLCAVILPFASTERVPKWHEEKEHFPTKRPPWDRYGLEEDNPTFISTDSYKAIFFVVLVLGFFIVVALIIYCKTQLDSLLIPQQRSPPAYVNTAMDRYDGIDSPPDYLTVAIHDRQSFPVVAQKPPVETPPPLYELQFPFQQNTTHSASSEKLI